jgi:hypothetical protein
MNGRTLRSKLSDLVHTWRKHGLPGRDALIRTAQNMIREHQDQEGGFLWASSPLFVTATLDDAWGQGLDIIEGYAKAAGMQVIRLGLLMSAEDVIAACRRKNPDFLAMTVLQIDSADDLVQIGRSLPEKTKFIAGGPAFRAAPEMAEDAGICFVAKNVADFLLYLLSL